SSRDFHRLPLERGISYMTVFNVPDFGYCLETCLKVPFQSAKTSAIAALLQHDYLSRLELSELTGVRPAGITEVTQKLLQHGRKTFVAALRSSAIPRSRVRGLGIAVAGIVDAQEGICRYSAALDWRDVPIAKMIGDALQLEAWADNDADAVAI